ncbi:unnamed protein product [marine sediment metagenome]|uniref:Uncharacterized protein n=1 Tax=marine sediment metagenome TaxID=412755 RepID=X1F617_9ZZZZ
MALQVRKINKAKWLRADIVNGAEIPADAITNCLRTQQNNLSVWKIKSEDEIESAVLAIISGQPRLETIDIALLSPEYLEQNGVKFMATEGKTAVKMPKDIHFDMVELTYEKLGVIAYHIVEKFKEKKVFRYTRKKLKDILNNAINEKRLDINKLSEDIKSILCING